MAAISPNGRFIAAAAFTADVKVWEILYTKDGSVKEVTKVMQLNGHKSAVKWLCFTPNSDRVITTSKDGSMRIWNINVAFVLKLERFWTRRRKLADGDITGLCWTPSSIPIGEGKGIVLATAGVDKKVKLWAAPALQNS
ncbi:hypothetical protein MLD38_018724 [Melastoma candidum]|uniref:Uncharacterized protein n=1 Tax=Melastoma candidum TaxID=119954 RepID=A0ACB9QUN1_9MYRT|nr:hypothetical protein MLD38_018724 [Melastoma candidum]